MIPLQSRKDYSRSASTMSAAGYLAELVSPGAQLVLIPVPLLLPGRAISVAWLWPVLVTFAALSLSLQSQASSEASSACRSSSEWPQWPPQEPHELRQPFRVIPLSSNLAICWMQLLLYCISSLTSPGRPQIFLPSDHLPSQLC